MTTITLTPDLEEAIGRQAQKQATTPETIVLDTLREKFKPGEQSRERTEKLEEEEWQPRNTWESMILGIGFDAGVSLTDEQVSREVIYEDHD